MEPSIGARGKAEDRRGHGSCLAAPRLLRQIFGMNIISSEADLAVATGELVKREPRFATVLERHGLPPVRVVPPGMASLLRIVTDQLISLQAGAAIWKRIENRFGTLTPEALASSSEVELRSLGLSGAKARCFLAVSKSALDFDRLHGLSDDDITKTLVEMPGIGPWTADIYLLAAAGRMDAWPAGDLALQIAAADLFSLPARPDIRAMKVLASPWSPYRSAAARLLWSHYRSLRGMTQNVI